MMVNPAERPGKLFHRIPLVRKVLLLSLLLGAGIWAAADYFGTITVQNAFEVHLRESLKERALNYRLSFNRYVNAFPQFAHVIVTRASTIQAMKRIMPAAPTTVRITDTPPDWVPETSLFRTFSVPSFMILLDASDEPFELYRTRHEQVPFPLLHINKRQLMLSARESYMTTIDGMPYLLASERIRDSENNHLGTLLLASPIDREFILSAIGGGTRDTIFVLVDDNRRVLSSSDPGAIPAGSSLDSIESSYKAIDQDFFEFGGSELNFKFTTLISSSSVNQLVGQVVRNDRMRHGIQALMFITSFTLLMLLNVRRIRNLTKRVEQFTRETLKGEGIEQPGRWDELHVLEDRFHLLTQEVQSATERIRIEAAESARREKELEHKQHALDLMLAVTEALGVGVALIEKDGLKPINLQMEYYRSMCEGITCFDGITEGKSIEREVKYRDGRTRTFSLLSPELASDQHVILAMDITERKLAEAEVINARMDWESTFNSITDMITIHDRNFNVIRANKAAREKLGIRFYEDRQTKCHEAYHGSKIVPAGCASCESLITGKPCTSETFEPHLNKYIEIRSIPRIDGEGNVMGLIHVVRDISQRKKLEDQLTHQALYDSLTGLANRVLLMDRLKNLFDHRRRDPKRLFAVLFIDLDNFKKINDSLGHAAGDDLLCAVAERLTQCTRPGDTVSRFGGDEFVILLDEVLNPVDVHTTASRIHHELNRSIQLKETESFITASIGVNVVNDHYHRPEEFLRDCDIAMYHAKADGKDRFSFFSHTMYSNAVHAVRIENDLRHALENEEFEVHYQPIVNLEAGTFFGFEALVRWNHPLRGLLMPGEFIQIAEETGLIVPLGRWVLNEACRQVNQWRNTFPDERHLTVSVNISSRQFNSDLVPMITSALSKTGLSPEFLKVEITESIIMDNPALASSMLKRLRAMEIQVYLDDFGTGYSSLNYLHKFPVNALKIDRSFVQNIMEDREAQEIVRAIASLARNLSMKVIVEGIEHHDQLELFRELQCNYVQGFLFSEPLPAALVEQYLRSYSFSNTD